MNFKCCCGATEGKHAFTANRPWYGQTIMTQGEVGDRIKNGTVWFFGPEQEPWDWLIITLSNLWIEAYGWCDTVPMCQQWTGVTQCFWQPGSDQSNAVMLRGDASAARLNGCIVFGVSSACLLQWGGGWLTWQRTVQRTDTPPTRPGLCYLHSRTLSPIWRHKNTD